MRYNEFDTDEKLDAQLQSALRAEKIPASISPEAVTARLQQEKRRRIRLSRKTECRIVAGLCACLVLVVSLSAAGVWKPNAPLQAEECYMDDAGSYHKLYQQMQYFVKLRVRASRLDEWTGRWTNELKNTDDQTQVAEAPVSEADGRQNADNTETPLTDSDASHSYSETLTQVAGIAEADCVKTDGNAIYYLRENLLWYLPIDGGKLGEAVAYTPDFDGAASDLYLVNGSAVVLYTVRQTDETTRVQTAAVTYTPDAEGNLIQQGTVWQEGSIVEHRMIGDTLYLVTCCSKPLNDDLTEDDLSAYVPTCGNTENCYLPPTDILIPDAWDSNVHYLGYTVVSAIDTKSAQVYSHKAFAGNSSSIYMSAESLYLVLYQEGETRITRVAYENHEITPIAVGKVQGSVLSQYSMSESNGVFRVATHSSENSLYTFNAEMEQLDSISFAPGEQIKAVNFVGDRAYVVTFYQTDPLFSIDCSDPSSLRIDDSYKVSGYSTFLYPWGEYLFSFGVESGNVNGVKMMMYDTAEDGTLTMLCDHIWYDDLTRMHSYSSCATSDYKALYFQPMQNVIGVPLSHYDYEIGREEFLYEFYAYDAALQQFCLLGRVASQCKGFVGSRMRCISVDDTLYLICDNEVISADRTDFTVLDRVRLAATDVSTSFGEEDRYMNSPDVIWD